MSCGLLPTSWAGCAADIAGKVAGDVFQSIATSFGDAADHALSWLWSQLNEATAVHLGGAGFDTELGIVAAITGVVAVALFVLQVLRSALRQDPGGLARAVKGLLVAFVGGGAAITVLDGLLGVTDRLSQGVVQLAAGTDIAGLGRLLIGAGTLATVVSGPAGLILLSLACIVASLVVYAALVVRKVLIVVTAVFAPLAFAGSLADLTVSWTRRWIETTLALVVSKLVLVLIFVAGYGILVKGVGQAGSGATQQVTQVISGVVVLCLAGFAPWIALKLVHFTGEQAHQLHSLGGVAMGGVSAVGRSARKAAPYVGRAHALSAARGASGAQGLRGAALAGGAAPGSAAPGSGEPGAGGGRGAGGGSGPGGPRGGQPGPRSPGSPSGPSSPGGKGRPDGGGRPGASGASGGARGTRTRPSNAGAPAGVGGARRSPRAHAEGTAVPGQGAGQPGASDPHGQSRGGQPRRASDKAGGAGAPSRSRSATQRPSASSAPETSAGSRASSDPDAARSGGETGSVPGHVRAEGVPGRHRAITPPGSGGAPLGAPSPSGASPERRPLSGGSSTVSSGEEVTLPPYSHGTPSSLPGAERPGTASPVRARPTSPPPSHPLPSGEGSS